MHDDASSSASSSVTPPAKPRPLPRPRLGDKLRTYFFAGVLVTAPLAITIYLSWLFLSFIDSQVRPLIPAPYDPETYLPFSVPGIGLIILLALLTLIGALTAGLVGRTFIAYSERLLARMPVVRGVYSALKQIIETVLAQQSTAFREVVLVEYPRRGVWTLGFITGVTKGEVQTLTVDEVVNVFLPTTPNPTSGFLLFVPRQDLIPLAMSVEDGIKMVISGGLVSPPQREAGTEMSGGAPLPSGAASRIEGNTR